MRLAKAVQKDSTTNTLPEEKMGISIDMDEIVDDTVYEEVEVKKEFVPQSKQAELPA